MLVSLNRVEHHVGTVVEVVLELDARVGEEVDHSSLLNEIEFLVKANVLQLLLGVNEVVHLDLLDLVGPLSVELLGLVARVCVVEDGEFGTGHEGKVTGLNVTKIEGDQELVVEDHTSHPLVVGPATEAGDRHNSGDVAEHEDKSTTGAG